MPVGDLADEPLLPLLFRSCTPKVARLRSCTPRRMNSRPQGVQFPARQLSEFNSEGARGRARGTFALRVH